jgi:hypothetical protein
MLSRKRPAVVSGWMLLLLALACAPAAAAQTGRQQPTPTPQNPPTISLSADNEVVTLCPDNVSVANPRVRLRAVGNSPDGKPLRYRWTTSGGRIEGDGTDVVWDLSNAQPGVYSATVTVESGPVGDPLCTAFTSTRVVVRNCPPPRPFCPNVSMYCPDVVQTGTPVTFTASTSGGTPGVAPVYNWKVSAGTITAGQGTPTITVDTAGLGGQPITASLEVEGYNLVCRASCQSSVPAPVLARRADEFGEVNRDDEKARLDLFAIEMQNEPGARGYILGYGGRKAKPGEGQRRADRARDYLVNTRGIEATRVVVVDGGLGETGRTELWVVPPGATPPRPR